MFRFHHITQISRELIRNPRKIALVLNQDDTDYAHYVKTTYGYPKGFPTVDLLDLFPYFSETVYPLSMLSDGSTPIDYALLKSFAKKFPHCQYLEIGTWRGESIANVAEIADFCYSISLSKEEMVKMGYRNSIIDNVNFFSKNLKNVEYIEADSTLYNFNLLNKKFDMIFIDGDHSKYAIESDTRNAFKLLKDENSIIVWHDYGFTPEHIKWETVAGILAGCPEEFRTNLYHVSNTLCAIFTREKYPEKFSKFPEIPNKVFEMTMKAKKIE